MIRSHHYFHQRVIEGDKNNGFLCFFKHNVTIYFFANLQGDSGGPLTALHPSSTESSSPRCAVIGVVSYGVRCADEDFPGVYARVTHFVEWIRRETAVSIAEIQLGVLNWIETGSNHLKNIDFEYFFH